MSAKIRKVKVLQGRAKKEAEKKGLKPNDLVIVKADGSIVKIDGDPVSYLLKCEKTGLLQKRLKELVEGITESSLLSQKDAVDSVLKVVEEMAKDLVLPIPYKHRTHWHKGKEVVSTTYLDKDLEEFKAKLKKWLVGE